MLDLPLGLPEDSREETKRAAARSPAGGAGLPKKARRRSWRRGLLILLPLLLGVALAIEFLLRPAPPSAAAIPEILDFGEARLDSVGVEERLLILNRGEKPMTVSTAAVIGEAAGDFRVVSEECTGRSLSGQERCTVALRFLPQEMGPRAARLAVEGELENSPARFALVGRGVAPLVAVGRAVIDFGRQGVGVASRQAELAVSNSGTAELNLEGLRIEGAAAADFELARDRCTGENLAPEESCVLRVLFRPRAAGARQARLVIRSDAARPPSEVRLAGSGEWSGPSLELDARSIDFGDSRVGGPPVRRPIRLTNRQEAALSGLSVVLEPEGQGLSLAEEDCGQTIAPGDGCGLVVVFAPEAEGEVSASLRFRHVSIREPLELAISGRGVAARLIFGQGAVDFQRRRVGTTSDSLSIKLENLGTASAKLERIQITGPENAAFVAQKDGCTGRTLEPGTSCSVALVFRPRREGPHRASLDVRPLPHRGPRSIALAGSGIAPRLQVDRELLDFGEVRRTARRDVELTLENSGTARLALQRIALAGDAAADFRLNAADCPSGSGLAPGARCSLRISFVPSSVLGRRNAKLVVDHDGLSGPREVPVGGTALPPPIPRLSCSPAALDFGPQPVGVRSAILTLTARNIGSGRLEFRDFSLAGADADDFYIVPATCDAAPSLVPGSDCTVGVRFVPSTAGAHRARLVIRSNSADGQIVVDLVGRGLGSGS